MNQVIKADFIYFISYQALVGSLWTGWFEWDVRLNPSEPRWETSLDQMSGLDLETEEIVYRWDAVRWWIKMKWNEIRDDSQHRDENTALSATGGISC